MQRRSRKKLCSTLLQLSGFSGRTRVKGLGYYVFAMQRLTMRWKCLTGLKTLD